MPTGLHGFVEAMQLRMQHVRLEKKQSSMVACLAFADYDGLQSINVHLSL